MEVEVHYQPAKRSTVCGERSRLFRDGRSDEAMALRSTTDIRLVTCQQCRSWIAEIVSEWQPTTATTEPRG